MTTTILLTLAGLTIGLVAKEAKRKWNVYKIKKSRKLTFALGNIPLQMEVM